MVWLFNKYTVQIIKIKIISSWIGEKDIKKRKNTKIF